MQTIVMNIYNSFVGKFRKATTVIASAVLIAAATQVNAASISYTDTVDVQSTNFVDTVSLSKFDPALGTLTSIDFEWTGHLEGTAKFESLDGSATIVTTNLAAELKLKRPGGGSDIVIATPLAQNVDNASAFDGTIDFGGTSGKTHTGLVADLLVVETSTSASDFALFSGIGNIILDVAATGDSMGSGAGNLITQFSTSAGASLKIIYNYDAVTPVPEPSTYALIIAGVGLLSLRRRRRS